MLCSNAKLNGRPVALIANRRGFIKTGGGPRIGGIVYTESARKVAYFVETAERLGLPLIYLQDVSGFMVGAEAETQASSAPSRDGGDHGHHHRSENYSDHQSRQRRRILRHGRPRIDPNFTFSWPTARIGVMEGDSAVQALYSVEIQKWKASGQPLPEGLEQSIEKTRADYESWLDSRYAAARGT